ncbi:MAG: PQQ-binding-like beta-propeller repeat protein, partial [Planctomycetaceae bacterium]
LFRSSNYSASRAAPTPVVDASGVYCFFEGGDVLALSHSGELLWKRDLVAEYGRFQNNHGLGSSPTQTDDLVILNIEHRGPSFLLALQKRTGATVWRSERPSGTSWTSPIVAEFGGELQVIVSSAGSVTGWSPRDGVQLWTVGGLAGNSV